MEIDGVWGLAHILFLVGFIIIAPTFLFLVHKYVKSKRTYDYVLLSCAAILLALEIMNRFFSCYECLVLNVCKQGPIYNSWWEIIPDTLCGMNSIVLSLAVIFSINNKNSLIFHFIVYNSLLTAIPVLFVPGFLSDYPCYSASSITSFLHHDVAIILALLVIMTGEFKPDIKKWYVYPLGYICYLIIGVFELTVLNFKNPFNMKDGLLSSMPVLTSWYVMFIASIFGVLLFLILFEHFKNKKPFKLIFQQMLFIKK